MWPLNRPPRAEEAELPSVGPLGPEIEGGEPQPVGDDVLATMPGLEET